MSNKWLFALVAFCALLTLFTICGMLAATVHWSIMLVFFIIVFIVDCLITSYAKRRRGKQ
jgi:hypothetical protein